MPPTTIKVGIIDSNNATSSPNHRTRMQTIIRNQVREKLGDDVTVEFVNIEADRDGNGSIQLGEYNESFVEANRKDIQYLCLAQEIEVDRNQPGAERALQEVDSNLNALSRKLGNYLFVSAGNYGHDNYFAHTHGVTVVGADSTSRDYTDPERYRDTADRIIKTTPNDPYSRNHGTSEATARALSNEIIADFQRNHPETAPHASSPETSSSSWWGQQLWDYVFGG